MVDEPSFVHEQGERNASIIQIDSGKHVATVALCAALCGLSVALSIWASQTALHAEKRVELANYYLMDPHSRTPAELASWAEFNRTHEEH